MFSGRQSEPSLPFISQLPGKKPTILGKGKEDEEDEEVKKRGERDVLLMWKYKMNIKVEEEDNKK